MPLTAFHPAIQTWFSRTFGEPTAPQRQGWPAIRAGKNTLIAAPTGTGKTLAAFLTAIDSLLSQGAKLNDQCQVLYISPLKALGNDIQKNLQVPLAGIRAVDESLPQIRVQVRTGDTTASDRQKMLRKPPHILVTTPESLYILLTSRGGRNLLSTVRTVIVDEIHAVAGDKRGAHLALSLERLEALAGPFQRIGLSATQKPLSDIADFLVGVERECTVVDAGHLRHLDLGVEIPKSPLEPLCSHEVWEEIYARISELIGQHRTTLIFVNTRKMAERMAARLSKLLGEERVACHHGSLSKERRLDSEQRLKQGSLSALVATASLELGIDIGDVDLVIQIGASRSIATFLQRVGRAGHGIHRTPKGRLFPLTIDELAEGAALMRAIRAKQLDRIRQPKQPLDILAQQTVAACVSQDWQEDELFQRFRRAWPYRTLEREQFDQVVALHANARLSLLHHDGVSRRIRATKRAPLIAIASGGAIPENAAFTVREEPEGTLIGTLDEDFSLESNPGDIFQLGNTSWRIVRIDGREGVMRVANAKGAPPSIPFWLGEAPSRTQELSEQIGSIREECTGVQWLIDHCSFPLGAAEQLWTYFCGERQALGVLPSHRHIVAERFFDESGGTQLVMHAPFGARINRAWALALRKRFCNHFGFELEAAATEDAFVLSLAPSTSFKLDEVFSFLSPATVRDVLIQACITGGQFETRWRWNATRSLLVERFGKGKKVPAFLQRIRANDALAAAFPQVAMCAENLTPGPIEIPKDHPLVQQTIDDCLTELLDAEGLIEVLKAIRAGQITTSAVDSLEPSPFARAIMAAQPYAFLDDTPAEERRTRAVSPSNAFPDAKDHIGELDPAVVEEVKAEAWPQPRDADELHETLTWIGYLTASEISEWQPWIDDLHRAGRIVREGDKWFAVEATRDPKEVLRGRMEAVGPIESDDPLMLALENDGVAVRTRLHGREVWCHRRLLARIHRRMIDRRRSSVTPETAATFLRFLACWQGADEEFHRDGPAGVSSVLDQLAGFEIPASAWDFRIMPARLRDYQPEWLNDVTLSGGFSWGRLWHAADAVSTPMLLRSTPISLIPRDQLDFWLGLSPAAEVSGLGGNARLVYELMEKSGALFLGEIARVAKLLPEHLEMALSELCGRGLITCDSFAALRWLCAHSQKRGKMRPPGGRWSLFRRPGQALPFEERGRTEREDLALGMARQLIKRTGVVFRKTTARERHPIPWRDCLYALRTLEMRGEVLGGRFVAGFSGEQFAAPEAAELLKRVGKRAQSNQLRVSAADPLNLQGILTPDERVRPLTRTWVEVG